MHRSPNADVFVGRDTTSPARRLPPEVWESEAPAGPVGTDRAANGESSRAPGGRVAAA
jgi:hypothetical protein